MRTRDIAELSQRLSALFYVRSMDMARGEAKSFEGRLNHRQLQDVGLVYARYGAPLLIYPRDLVSEETPEDLEAKAREVAEEAMKLLLAVGKA